MGFRSGRALDRRGVGLRVVFEGLGCEVELLKFLWVLAK